MMKKLTAVLMAMLLLAGCVNAQTTDSTVASPTPTPYIKLENKAVDGEAMLKVTVTAEDGLPLMEEPSLMSRLLRKVDAGTVLSCYGKMTDDNSTRTWYDVKLDDGSDAYLLVYNLSDVTETSDDETSN